MKKAGIDTSIFKAHSTRGAATTAAANAGITTEDILKAADWSSDTVFKKFYYKPTQVWAVCTCPTKVTYLYVRYNYRMAQPM